MPVYVLRNRGYLVRFQPILRYLYANSEMFNIIKVRHTGTQCVPGSWEKVRRTLSLLHLIYIEPQLAKPMRQLLNHLKRVSSPANEDENEGDEDPRNHPTCLMSCPFCGSLFQDQATRYIRTT